MESEPVDGAARSLGERLGALEPRLSLLVAHLVGRALRRRVEPSDLVQETFLRALAPGTRLPAVEEGEEALFRVLARIARHAVIDAARAARSARRDGAPLRLERSSWSRVGVAESALPSRGPGPPTAAAGREAGRRALETFLALPPEYRRVLALRRLEGLGAAETARRMGRSEAAVHSLFRRALAAFEHDLGRGGPGPGPDS